MTENIKPHRLAFQLFSDPHAERRSLRTRSV